MGRGLEVELWGALVRSSSLVLLAHFRVLLGSHLLGLLSFSTRWGPLFSSPSCLLAQDSYHLLLFGPWDGVSWGDWPLQPPLPGRASA